jgi:O-antigen/teichoic acid export membrane protein
MCATALFNVAMDALLIPRGAAVGAAVANGVAQIFAVGGLFWLSTRLHKTHFPTAAMSRIAVTGVAMVAAVVPMQRLLSPTPALVAGVIVGAVVFAVMLRVTHAAGVEDVARMRHLTERMPAAVRNAAEACLRFVVPESRAGKGIGQHA